MPNQVPNDLPVELKDYQEFLKGVRKLEILGPDVKRKVVEQFVHKIEVKPDGFILHYNVGRDQLRKEPKKSGSSSHKVFVLNRSNSLTNGDRGKD
jgi:hypothetical protein